MRDYECDVGVLPLQCYNVTWGNLIPQCTHAHMRITECDNKMMGGGAFVITLVDPEAGGRAGSLCMYITPKDFLIKIPEPTGSYQSLTTEID